MAENQNNRSREQCILLRSQGYSQRKIAEILGVSQSTVRFHTRYLPPVTQPTVAREYRRSQGYGYPLPPSAELAYLVGIIAGDGNLYQTTKTCQLSIACDLRYPELIEEYRNLVERVTGCQARVQTRAKAGKNQTWAVVVAYDHHLPVMLGLRCGPKKTSGFEVPEWIWQDREYVRALLRGLIETDGGVYCTHHNGGEFWYCAFTAKVPAVIGAFQRAVVYCGYEFRRYGFTFRLSNSELTRRLVQELSITKLRQYRYD